MITDVVLTYTDDPMTAEWRSLAERNTRDEHKTAGTHLPYLVTPFSQLK